MQAKLLGCQLVQCQIQGLILSTIFKSCLKQLKFLVMPLCLVLSLVHITQDTLQLICWTSVCMELACPCQIIVGTVSAEVQLFLLLSWAQQIALFNCLGTGRVMLLKITWNFPLLERLQLPKRLREILTCKSTSFNYIDALYIL